MTAADHANTVRKALPAGIYTNEDRAARAAVDALEAQAEAAEYMVGWRKRAWNAEAERDTAWARCEEAEHMYDQMEAERDLLADALRAITYHENHVSTECRGLMVDIARSALARTETKPDEADGLTDDERNHRRDNALNYGKIDRLRAERDRLADALREIEDTEWGNASYEVSGPNEIARAALARTENTP